MTFQWPALLWGLLVIPVAVAAYRFAQRARMRHAVRFTNLDLLAGQLGRKAAWRRYVPTTLYLLALAVLLLGFARPQATVSVPREQATIVLSMDTSGSMTATDVRPSRMSAAQASARAFLDQLPRKFRVGVVSFSDSAQILAQPTTDRATVRDAISSMDAGGATAMGDGIVEALDLRARRSGSEPQRGVAPTPGRVPGGNPSGARQPPLDAVLLLSDGYNTSGQVSPREAAARARALGIPVFTIALGTPEGVVPGRDRFGNLGLVPVPPDYDTLREIAETTDGEFFIAPDEDDLRRIYGELGSRIGFEKEKQEVTFAFAAGGLLLAAAAVGLSALWTGRFP